MIINLSVFDLVLSDDESINFFFCTGERRQSGDCRHGAKVRLFKVCVYVFSVCLFCFFYIFFLKAFFGATVVCSFCQV